MQATQTTTVYLNDPENNNDIETDCGLEEFKENVTEGDYIAVVYETPSNGNSWHRSMGHVKSVRTLDGSFDDLHFEIEDSDRDEAGDIGYFHLHSSGQYFFSDNNESDNDWGIKKIAWTQE